MLVSQRRTHLLELLSTTGSVVAKEVAAEFGVSEDSIRRDLRDLAAEGLCQRVYGGAVPASPAVASYQARASLAPAAKRTVASAAVRLITAGSTVILDGGTTALAIARTLPRDLKCTVITTSPTIAVALLDHPSAELFLLGGRVFKHSATTSGAAAMEAAQAVTADVCFLGVTGVHPDAGLTTGDVEDAAMKRALASRAAETYILASSEKIGTASRYRVLPWDQTAGIITDADSTDETIREIAALGATVISTRVE